jgi:hypothetical protein
LLCTSRFDTNEKKGKNAENHVCSILEAENYFFRVADPDLHRSALFLVASPDKSFLLTENNLHDLLLDPPPGAPSPN